LPKVKDAYARLDDDEGYLRFLQGLRREIGSLSVVLGLIEALKGGDDVAVDEIFATELSRPTVSLKIIREFVQTWLESGEGGNEQALRSVRKALDSHLERQASHLCCRCGLETKGLFWQCPSCHGWGTFRPVDQIDSAHGSVLAQGMAIPLSSSTAFKRRRA
jgi:lipopolysaccharide biosynthesis regulator YciM